MVPGNLSKETNSTGDIQGTPKSVHPAEIDPNRSGAPLSGTKELLNEASKSQLMDGCDMI